MSVYLRVKIKSLAAEATIIRREERRAKLLWQKYQNPTFFSLQGHRRCEVRPEARAALLAYGFLRGRTYHQIENKCHEPPNWHRVTELVRKYGTLSKEQSAIAVKSWGDGEIAKAD